MTDARDVRTAVQICAGYLDGHVDDDWTARAADIDMSVGELVAHVAEGCLWYAIDLAAGGRDLPSVEQRVTTDVPNRDLIETLKSYAFVVAAVIDASPETARGFHPMGAADPSGFAAMACDEMLIHTDDAARALGHRFRPPDDLASAVLQRLFPWVHGDEDAWELLCWANGRIALEARERHERWAWHCAPLAEWDGSIPDPPPRRPTS